MNRRDFLLGASAVAVAAALPEGPHVFKVAAAAEGPGSYVLNVMDFGAVADGVTDDRAAIQACFNAAYSAFPDGSVYFPAGSYGIRNSIDFRGVRGGYRIGDAA